jgi:hypothetical protein
MWGITHGLGRLEMRGVGRRHYCIGNREAFGIINRLTKVPYLPRAWETREYFSRAILSSQPPPGGIIR